MKDARLLKILVEEKALVKLLKTIGAGKAYPTRELLTKLGAYASHKKRQPAARVCRQKWRTVGLCDVPLLRNLSVLFNLILV